MASINLIKGSDGTGNAAMATVTSLRSPSATTIQVNTVAGIPATFMASMGTPHTYTDPISGETITVISEATAVDFEGHVDGSNLEIDSIAPGYTDNGSQIGDVVVIRPTTEWANNVADVLSESHEDDGKIKPEAASEAAGDAGFYKGAIYKTATGTYDKPADLKFVIVEVVGGGGGSGGAASSAGGNSAFARGGSGGGYALKKILASSLSSSETVTVGAGGTAGSAGNNAGGDGGATSFGSHVTANPGSGGNGAVSANAVAIVAGKTGGTATGGDINIVGGATGN